MRLARLLAIFALTACVPTTNADVSMNRTREATGATTTPVARSFTAATVRAPSRSNAEIAANFIDLEFRMESGRALPVFTRFEGPVTVALKGDVPGSAHADLARLLTRFRSEAGIDIRQTGDQAAITVEFLPRRQIQAAYANVACFVVPRVSGWAEYRASRGKGVLDWTTMTKRENVSIFVPSDSSPQEVRDCLHEEIAQAMGPLNDLYYLPDSVFNDDNFHTVLTSFDMLVLRLHYSGQLRSGMTQSEVAALLPGLLAQMNPAGQKGGQSAGGRTPNEWIKSMETALGPRARAAARAAAAQNALSIAHAQGWQDGRLAFSYFAVGRLNAGKDTNAAITAFNEAARIYRSLPGGAIHAAHVDMQLAATALSAGDAVQAIALADRAIPVVRAAENASLLATLMMVKAEALDLQGQSAAARAVRLDSQAWARYGFGSDAVVRARMKDISSLAPSRLRLQNNG